MYVVFFLFRQICIYSMAQRTRVSLRTLMGDEIIMCYKRSLSDLLLVRMHLANSQQCSCFFRSFFLHCKRLDMLKILQMDLSSYLSKHVYLSLLICFGNSETHIDTPPTDLTVSVDLVFFIKLWLLVQRTLSIVSLFY